ncbi:MAG: Rpn family recombination-promoting nuclease/putative transposase [Candidatus Cryptobacteroides sp.]
MQTDKYYEESEASDIRRKYVNLMSNAGFKAVFGDENNKDVVINVLNQMLSGHRHVADITYLKTEYQGPLLKNKEYHYDFMCRDIDGSTFIVEMQCYPEQYWFRRCVSYCCRAYDRQGRKGDVRVEVGSNYSIPPVYFIGFMGTDIGHPDEEDWVDRYVSEYTFREKRTHDLLDETIFIIFAELTRFHKSLEECESAQDKLFYLFKNIGKMEEADESWRSDKFWEAFFEACEIAAFSEDKRIQYEQEMYDERRLQGELDASMEIGLKKGLERGREEGRAEGFAKGEEKEKIATAKRMLADGLSAETVARYSDLPVEKVLAL